MPWPLIVAPAVFLVGYVGFALPLGDWLLGLVGYRGGSVMLGAVTGVIALQLVRLIPVAGQIAVTVVAIVGFGAAIAAFVAWRAERRTLRAAPAEPQAAPAPDSTIRAA